MLVMENVCELAKRKTTRLYLVAHLGSDDFMWPQTCQHKKALHYVVKSLSETPFMCFPESPCATQRVEKHFAGAQRREDISALRKLVPSRVSPWRQRGISKAEYGKLMGNTMTLTVRMSLPAGGMIEPAERSMVLALLNHVLTVDWSFVR